MSQFDRRSAIPWTVLQRLYPERWEYRSVSYQDCCEAGYTPYLAPSTPFAIKPIRRHSHGRVVISAEDYQRVEQYRAELAEYDHHVTTNGREKLPDHDFPE